MPTRANRDTNSYGMKVGNGAQAPHTEIEDRICLNIPIDIAPKKEKNFRDRPTGLMLIAH